MSQEEFKILYDKASAGDSSALGILYLQYKNVIYSLANRYATESVPVDDLASEARVWFVSAIVGRRFNADTGKKFMSYLYPSIKGIMLNYVRSNATQITMKSSKNYVLISLDGSEGFDIEEELIHDHTEEKKILVKALNELPKEQRYAILSHYWKLKSNDKVTRQGRDCRRINGIKTLKRKMKKIFA